LTSSSAVILMYYKKNKSIKIKIEDSMLPDNTWLILWLMTLTNHNVTSVFFFSLSFTIFFCYFIYLWHYGWSMLSMSSTTISHKCYLMANVTLNEKGTNMLHLGKSGLMSETKNRYSMVRCQHQRVYYIVCGLLCKPKPHTKNRSSILT